MTPSKKSPGKPREVVPAPSSAQEPSADALQRAKKDAKRHAAEAAQAKEE